MPKKCCCGIHCHSHFFKSKNDNWMSAICLDKMAESETEQLSFATPCHTKNDEWWRVLSWHDGESESEKLSCDLFASAVHLPETRIRCSNRSRDQAALAVIGIRVGMLPLRNAKAAFGQPCCSKLLAMWWLDPSSGDHETKLPHTLHWLMP